MVEESEAAGETAVEQVPPSPETAAFGVVKGIPLTKLPEDLYIPPDAMEVFLETFEGPLDLLLYLIRRQNLDILDIPIAEITHQYMDYVEVIKEMNLELAADYLVMAAILAEIKSRMLLPRPESAEDEEDPRAVLVRRLQEYERFKKAAEDLDELPRMHRETFPARAEPPQLKLVRPHPQVDLREVLVAFSDVLKRAQMFTHHHIQREPLSVRERMAIVLDRVHADRFIPFQALFTVEEGRKGVVVTLLAILELVKESMIELVQNESFGPIHVKAVA